MSYTLLDLAYDVLKKAPEPLPYQQIWRVAVEQGLAARFHDAGKTPWQSLGSRLYVDVRDNPVSRFLPVGKRPVRFFLKERASSLPADVAKRLDAAEPAPVKKDDSKRPMRERELHPLLAYFVYSSPTFNRGRRIHTKTIYHERSVKAGYNEWIHPDMVGFYLPFGDWEPNVIEFNRVSDNNSLRLFSFELKKSLSKSNYRESYFQAVSNSSWAHEGYLVAADILEDDDFHAELERLASSFGIGIIHLDADDVDSSRVIFPARSREILDWDTVNKLCEQNSDFATFLRNVKIDFDAREIHGAKYDAITIGAAAAERFAKA